MSKVSILGAEFELNMFDAADAKRVSDARRIFEAQRLAIEAEKDNMELWESITEICHAAFTCFNSIFGDGADVKIFHDKCDLCQCVEAMAQLGKACTETQTDAFNQRFAAYLPNRAQRKV